MMEANFSKCVAITDASTLDFQGAHDTECSVKYFISIHVGGKTVIANDRGTTKLTLDHGLFVRTGLHEDGAILWFVAESPSSIWYVRHCLFVETQPNTQDVIQNSVNGMMRMENCYTDGIFRTGDQFSFSHCRQQTSVCVALTIATSWRCVMVFTIPSVCPTPDVTQSERLAASEVFLATDYPSLFFRESEYIADPNRGRPRSRVSIVWTLFPILLLAVLATIAGLVKYQKHRMAMKEDSSTESAWGWLGFLSQDKMGNSFSSRDTFDDPDEQAFQ
jgi:hypothetical protein